MNLLTSPRTPRFLGREAIARMTNPPTPALKARLTHAVREVEPPLWKLVAGLLGIVVLIPLACLAGWAFFMLAFSL